MLSQRMKDVLREGDTLSRIGGDEFVAVLNGLEHEIDCFPIIERLLNVAAQPFLLADLELTITVSIGVTFYPRDNGEADLRVGVYCFTQAVNEDEAREEAQACVYVLNGRQLDYPIYYDTEATGTGSGRADGLGVEDRTKCAVAFCEEVKALGYQPGVYASTTWFRKRLDMSQLTKYNIWNAHYNVASSPIACNMWQGSCTARIPGYGGQIDVNISYMG